MTGFTAVLLYILWMLALALSYASPRVPKILFGKRAANTWERNQPNPDSALMVRLKGAHLNCTENFPIFAAIVVIAALMNRSAVVDSVAAIFLGARIAQSSCHALGENFALIGLRASFFLVQVGLSVYLVWQLLH